MARRARALRSTVLWLSALTLLFLGFDMVESAQGALSADGPAGSIVLTSPAADGAATNNPTVRVAGQISNPGATVTVNGALASTGDGGNFLSIFGLEEGVNIVRVVGADGPARTQLSFVVILDTAPPVLSVFSPLEGQRLPDDRVAVFGQSEVGARVTVNGVAADAHVFDGSFEVPSLALASTGAACLQAQAVIVQAADAAGNVASVVRTVVADHCVTHPVLSAPLPTLEVFAGSTTSVPLDLPAYFSDDAASSDLIFSMYVGQAAASAFTVSFSEGELQFHWADASFSGPAAVTIVAVDRAGEFSDPVFLSLVVRPGAATNRAPMIVLPSGGQIEALPTGGTVSFVVATADLDGDHVELTVGAVSSGLRVTELLPLSPAGNFRVTVTADPGTPASASGTVELVATDGRLASARSTVVLRLYDASLPVTLTLESPAVPEVQASDLSTVNQVTGVWVEVGATRRVGHLFLNPPWQPARREVAAGNLDSTFWRFFVPLPNVGGSHRVTVWAADAGLAEQPFSFDIVIVAPPAAPLIDRLSLVSLQPDDEVGAWASLEWVGTVPSISDTTFEWRVDGQVVSSAAQLRNFPLEVGTHAVELTASTPGGSASSSVQVTVEARPAQLPTRPGPNYALWLGLGIVLGLGFVLMGTEVGLYFVMAGVVGAIIDRKHREKLLSHFVRGRIYQIIEYEPGIHLSELQRKAGTARGACAYHLHALEKAGLVKTSRDGMYLRFFVTKVAIDPETYALAEGDREILKEIEAKPGITDLEIGQRLARSSGSVARSVQKLTQSGYIEARREGKTLLCFPRTLPGGQPAPEGGAAP